MHRLDSPETDIHSQLRARLREFGVLAWRLGSDGKVLEPPRANGVLATWICNHCLVQRLEDVAAEAASGEEPSRRTIGPGCEVVLLPIRMRRRVVEWTAAMFLSPAALEDNLFTDGCARVHVDPVAARKAVLPIATFTDAEIERWSRLLPAMADDLERHARDDTALRGFTTTLSEAYEQIELNHRLAGRMRNIEQPDKFIGSAIEGVLDATEFRWAAFFAERWPGQDRHAGPMLIHAGEQRVSAEMIADFLAQSTLGQEPAEESIILNDERAERLSGHPDQVVAYAVLRDKQLAGVLLVGDKGGDDPQVSTYDTRVIDSAGAFTRSYYEIVSLLHEQQEMFLGSLRAITAALDAKDSYTRGHSERVAHLAARLAAKAGLSDEEIERIHIAGLMHDVGKIGVPESVLRKPGRLTDEEFDEIKKHPTIGRDILGGIPQLADIIPGVLWHHERWDGRGYPDGKPGEETPIIARILAVADSFDAMSSNRAYRPAKPRDEVLAEIARVAGSQLDPELAALFVTLDFAEYDRMVARHKPQDKHLGRAA